MALAWAAFILRPALTDIWALALGSFNSGNTKTELGQSEVTGHYVSHTEAQLGVMMRLPLAIYGYCTACFGHFPRVLIAASITREIVRLRPLWPLPVSGMMLN